MTFIPSKTRKLFSISDKTVYSSPALFSLSET
jgi:hypothetical protein